MYVFIVLDFVYLIFSFFLIMYWCLIMVNEFEFFQPVNLDFSKTLIIVEMLMIYIKDTKRDENRT